MPFCDVCVGMRDNEMRMGIRLDILVYMAMPRGKNWRRNALGDDFDKNEFIFQKDDDRQWRRRRRVDIKHGPGLETIVLTLNTMVYGMGFIPYAY